MITDEQQRFTLDDDVHRILVLEFADKADTEAFDAAPHNGKIARAIQILASQLWPE